MSDTTNIMDLPTDPVGGGSVSNNISLSASEKINSSQSQPSQSSPSVSLDSTTINQIITGIQQASVTGSTQLSSRDIPMNTSTITNDPQIQPNFIPQPQHHNDYINEYVDNRNMIDNYNKNMRHRDSLDEMYNELQTPLLIAILYFLFQLPIVRKKLFYYIPILFSSDGNLNVNGFIVTSILFGLSYYVLNKITTHFDKF
jgi:hypothetical protein